MDFVLQKKARVAPTDVVPSIVNTFTPPADCFPPSFKIVANTKYPEGSEQTYSEYPTQFVYNQQDSTWHPRRKGQSISKLNYVPPSIGELYYMCILLTVQKGCCSYEDIRTVNGHTLETFEKTCFQLGLLEDDKEFVDTIIEASDWATGNQLRRLFVTLLSMNTMSQPSFVFESTWMILSDGIVYNLRRQLHKPCNFS